MKKNFTVDLSASGIDELINGLHDYVEWTNRKANELVDRLAQAGMQVASAGFESAVYDGTNDFSVSVADRGDMCRGVVAVGSTVLFVEFGTGVTYPDNHPEAAQNGMIRGQYGQGKGSRSMWGYYGDDPGTNGVFATKKDGTIKEPHVVLTHGNPANMPMYSSAKDLRDNFQRIAKEVFSGD